MGWLHRLDRLIGHIVAATQWLALPLILLLFLQWPLRDIVRCCSREANDLGQIIFALFVAVSVTAATRAGTHLAADTLAQRYSARTRHWLKRIGTAVSVLPWALFVVIRRRELRHPLGARPGGFRRHRQSRLFHHQGGVVVDGDRDHRAVAG